MRQGSFSSNKKKRKVHNGGYVLAKLRRTRIKTRSMVQAELQKVARDEKKRKRIYGEKKKATEVEGKIICSQRNEINGQMSSTSNDNKALAKISISTSLSEETNEVRTSSLGYFISQDEGKSLDSPFKEMKAIRAYLYKEKKRVVGSHTKESKGVMIWRMAREE